MVVKRLFEDFENKEICTINSFWKKLNKNQDLICDHTLVVLVDDVMTIKVDEKNIEVSLLLTKDHLLAQIREVFPKIKDINIVRVKENSLKREEKKINNIDNEHLEQLKRKQIFENVVKKYEHLEDGLAKNIIIAFEAKKKISEYEFKKEKYVICYKCRAYFKPVLNENSCILCRNKEFNKKISEAREKIEKKQIYTYEEAKIYKIKEDIFGRVMDQLANEKLIEIYEKIRIEIMKKKKVIYLNEDLNKLAMLYFRTYKSEIIKSYINKLKEKLKKNISTIYNVDVEIK